MIAEILARGIRLFSGVQARWIGCRPDTSQRVYFANHTSNLDFLVLWSILPREVRRTVRPVAAGDYWRKGPIRLFLANSVFRGILIEREKVTRSNNPLVQLVAILKAGESLIIFPEGGRTTDAAMRPFKSGLYHLGRAMPAVDLVPVYIDNASRILPKGEFLPIPLLCSVNIGAPIHVRPAETKVAFLIRARDAVEDCSRT
jgi:1-acyl-sn-glycerol-3-phosphate acyltransferase